MDMNEINEINDMNKVSVKIYGQEYVLSGDKSRDHIMKVADYVNTKMYELASEAEGIALSSLGVLTAVNVSDDYFDALGEANNLKSVNAQLEKDGAHYIQLWEEAKEVLSITRKIRKQSWIKKELCLQQLNNR